MQSGFPIRRIQGPPANLRYQEGFNVPRIKMEHQGRLSYDQAEHGRVNAPLLNVFNSIENKRQDHLLQQLHILLHFSERQNYMTKRQPQLMGLRQSMASKGGRADILYEDIQRLLEIPAREVVQMQTNINLRPITKTSNFQNQQAEEDNQ